MSKEHKFFDEKTATLLLGKYGFMTRLHSLVELESEIHVVNLKNEIAGTFRVVWVNTQCQDGFHQLGVEVYEAPDDMWGVYFPPDEPGAGAPGGHAWLECKNCHQKQLGKVPQAELEFLAAGVLVARQCEQCKATTAWEFIRAAEPGEDSSSAPPAGAAKDKEDLRAGERSNLKLTIKLIRELNGSLVEDICETRDVSKIGAYFPTLQKYQVGEVLKVVFPYQKEGAGQVVVGKVIRLSQIVGTPQHAVAVQFETAVSAPELEPTLAGPALAAKKKAQVDLRTKGRVPLKLPIKVSRQVYGMKLEDVGETINISRTGAYYQTSQNYSVGEMVQVVLPYKKGQHDIPVRGRVVRLDQLQGSYTRAVAIHMVVDMK